MKICPLCLKSVGFSEISGPDNRSYSLCENCYLIFTNTRQQVTLPSGEPKISIPRQSSLLKKLFTTLPEYITPEMEGLDYYSTQIPVIANGLRDAGLNCEPYDPIHFPDLPADKKYDFIIANRCFERFFFPVKEVQKLNKIIKEDGFLVIITELWLKPEKMRTWTYAKNKMHVSFLHSKTIDYLAEKYAFNKLYSDDKHMIILQKKKVEVEEQAIEEATAEELS